jgi:hypothetical protein
MIFWMLVACEPQKTRTVVVVHTADEDEEDPELEEEDPEESTTTTTTTTTTEAEPEGPAIEEIEILELEDLLEVSVSTQPGTAPLEGGTLVVEFDEDEPLMLAIPEDLLSAEGDVLTFTLDRPKVGQCTLGAVHTLGVELLDEVGLSSGQAEAELETSPVGVVVDEVGSDYAWILGVVTAQTLICGTLESTGNDGLDYTGDLDITSFRVDPTGDWDVHLDWEVSGDWDLYLFEQTSSGTYAEINASTGPDLQGPEALTSTLYRSGTYAFEVAGWSGSAGDWTVTIY